ncbi:Eukaryotic translation initiation factor 4G [Phytophthora citrophthora]|uniref:Eukaryotic translation initiation factor 4G n=1 Tax=Phytophthora citrophthora TaxID=4793 RepID=A0AAD9GRI7_9STRA|nr:Eukaryotic translation initiation factor 4G [Phytophthora citrophthora]
MRSVHLEVVHDIQEPGETTQRSTGRHLICKTVKQIKTLVSSHLTTVATTASEQLHPRNMSKLNPNAGEWVPTFSAPVSESTASPVKSSSVASPVKEKTTSNRDKTPVKKSEVETPTKAVASPDSSKTALERAAEFGHDVALDENGEPISYEGYSPLHDRFIYSKEYLLTFQPVGDRVIKSIHPVVRNPTPPKKIGSKVKGRLVYTVAELLKFQPLYEMMPEDFTWADTIGADAVMGENKGKKGKKDKSRQQRNVMSYDASLVCYFNPTEYAAAMNMGLYTGPPAEESANASDGKNKAPAAEPVNPVEEAIIAKRRIATLLDDVKPDTVDSILESFGAITISSTHTMQEIIGLLFDHAIANPALSDSYAKLCTGMSERTPEFKDGAKTINFRRILLTKCYESLIEEPDRQPLHLASKKNGSNAPGQHSWRRKCMLQNVGLVGELFRRQLLTENIMHVCVAMMLDDEVKPHVEIIEAACGLLNLVGDLLDGSSPASRRTMDEYFAVLVRIQENCQLPDRVKKLITDLKVVRAGGWAKSRPDSSSASSTPVTSPAKATDSESNGTISSPVKAVETTTAPVTGETSPVESRTSDIETVPTED